MLPITCRPKKRNVKAVFAEFNLPVTNSLELNIAVRHDQYDGFGGTTNPKYSFKWHPIDWLVFRGAYSTGFKVPDFAKLFRGITETQYTGLDLADPAKCPNGRYNPDVANCNVQIRPDIVTGGNPNLQPEEAKAARAGRCHRTDGQLQCQRGLVANRALQHHPQRIQSIHDDRQPHVCVQLHS